MVGFKEKQCRLGCLVPTKAPNSELPVVYMTGDCGDQWASCGVPNSVLLSKPFAPSQVTTAVAQLLNAETTVGS